MQANFEKVGSKLLYKKAFALFAVLILFSSGCFGGLSSEEVIKIGTWRTAQTIQPFFYENYVDFPIEVLPFTNPGDQKTALLAGSLHMCGTTLVTAIIAASQNEPILIVAALSNKCSALVVGIDSGIETEADLRGKTIAYVPGTMHHLLLLSVLNQNGISVEEVTLIRVDFFDMGLALRQGQIDAFLSGEPFPSMAQLEGFGKILSYPYFEDEMGTINSAMITTRDMVENNPALVQALVNAHIQSSRYLIENPDSWLAKSITFGNDPDVLRFSFNNIELRYHIDERYISQVKVLAQKMYDLGMITNVPDVEAMFNLEFLGTYT